MSANSESGYSEESTASDVESVCTSVNDGVHEGSEADGDALHESYDYDNSEENDNADDDDDDSVMNNGKSGGAKGERGTVDVGFASTSMSSALANDWQALQKARSAVADDSAVPTAVDHTQREEDGSEHHRHHGEAVKKCCMCGSLEGIYKCPACGRRTCSITCVRCHKETFGCGGVRRVEDPVPLSAFTDSQVQRDFNFLEACRRAFDNAERSFPKTWRYNYKNLPPPLRALREAARHRGVVCQITSEGMAKRKQNSSHYNRNTSTIMWHCEFHFHRSQRKEDDFSISTNWGNERHKLGDIVRYCWATNPSLPCFEINRTYNKMDTYLGKDEQRQDTEPGSSERAPETATATETHESGKEAGVVEEAEEEVVAPAPEASSPAQQSNRNLVEQFLGQQDGSFTVLAKAERLGSEQRYFYLDTDKTLNENLRVLFFVNEYPVFEVIHTADREHYPSVTDEDKEAIRNSFKKVPKPPRERRKASDCTPEELETLRAVPCRLFLKKRCTLGDDCPFLHCEAENVPLCRAFTKFGNCRNPKCVFRHDPSQVKGRRNMKRPRSS